MVYIGHDGNRMGILTILNNEENNAVQWEQNGYTIGEMLGDMFA